MNIKDYLKYYVGQQCQTIAPDGIPHSILETINYYWLERSERDGTQLILILRKLEDITEEEAGEIFQLERNKDPEKGGHDFDLWREKYGFRITRLDLTEQHLMLGTRGELYWVVDVPKLNIQPANNYPLIFHYLLSKGFDLFSLIDSGAAIDTKTIQPQQQ